MPSPFPGMDPYLEGELWQEFHETLAGAIRAQLIPHLRPKYVALLAKRYVIDRPVLSIIDVPPRIIYPDVHILKTPATSSTTCVGGTDVVVTEPATELRSFIQTEVPLLRVEIRDVANRRLVAFIEILSPANKRGDGRREYHEKRSEILLTDVHLLELDLLRQGIRIPLEGEPPAAHYYIYLSRADRRPYTQVWPVALRQPLPTVPVPLLSPDPDVPLDVQAAVRACFDLVGYERLLDYTAPFPPPTLAEADATWMEERLRTAGFRSANEDGG